MEFSLDFAEKLKKELPAELQGAVDAGLYPEIAQFLDEFLSCSFTCEEIANAYWGGGLFPKIVVLSLKAIDMRRLREGLEEEWDRQRCSLRTTERS